MFLLIVSKNKITSPTYSRIETDSDGTSLCEYALKVSAEIHFDSLTSATPQVLHHRVTMAVKNIGC